jgi:diaminopimelate epimerase
MRIWNADGSEAELCGNGLRCVVRYAVDRGLVGDRQELLVQTPAGVLACRIEADGMITTELGAARRLPEVLEPGLIAVDLGNPHAVQLVEPDQLPRLDLAVLATPIQARFPGGANVACVAVHSPELLHMRPFERGSGATAACGSGAAAAVLATAHLGLTGPRVQVIQPGGELLITLRPGAGEEAVAWQTGPARIVFRGVLA